MNGRSRQSNVNLHVSRDQYENETYAAQRAIDTGKCLYTHLDAGLHSESRFDLEYPESDYIGHRKPRDLHGDDQLFDMVRALNITYFFLLKRSVCSLCWPIRIAGCHAHESTFPKAKRALSRMRCHRWACAIKLIDPLSTSLRQTRGTMFTLILLALLVLALLGRAAYSLTRRCPGAHTVPLYISLYDAWRGIGEIEFYNTRLRHILESHGAVNLWDNGQWTLLVTKPEYLAHIFRNERAIVKGGFYRKAPNTTMANLFGENIIDSTGELWKHFTAIMKPGIQRQFSPGPLYTAAHKLLMVIERHQQQAAPDCGIIINDIIQWWATDVYGQYFLDVDLGCLDSGTARAQQAFRKVIQNFPPLFLVALPFLERISTLLFPSCRRASQTSNELVEALLEAVATRPLLEKGPVQIKGNRSDKLIYRLQRARDSGQLTEFHYRSNMKMMFIAGHENVKTSLVSALHEIAEHPHVQERLYQEIVASGAQHGDNLKNLPYLTAVIYETLRLYPPLVQFINRKTLEPVYLKDGITIPQGTWVGWSSYGVHTDPSTWGPDARKFQPERWGSDVQAINRLMRTYQNRGMYIAFNAWSRMCIGAEFALLQMRVTVSQLVRQFIIRKDPNYELLLNEVSISFPSRFASFQGNSFDRWRHLNRKTAS